ncbi:MAG: ComEC/Rec2 family competence protein, partial [Pseudomonadota bacterium]
MKWAVALLAGGFAAQHSRDLVSWDQCLPILVALAALYFMRRLRLVVAFGIGFFLLHLASALIIEDRIDEKYAGDSMLTVVRVIDFPDTEKATTTMIVAPLDDARLPAKSRVTWFEAPVRPALGDVWQLEVRLRRPRGAANPGGFDSERWMFRERIHAAGYVVPGQRNRLLASGDLGPVDRIRTAFVRVTEATPGAQGVIAAVAVGARQHIDRDQWDRYAQTGTSHLVAISGLHIGLAAMAAFAVIYAASVLLGCSGSHVRHAIAGGVLLAAAYAVISGLGVPAQRASLMLMLSAVAMLARRRLQPGRVLAVCAVTVFFIDPVATLTPGFTLSFGAVAVLYRVSGNSLSGSRWSGYASGLWSA